MARGVLDDRSTSAMAKREKPYTILVAVDYAETGKLALERAFELAVERPNAELHVLHVLPLKLPVVVPDVGVTQDALPTLEEASEELAAYVAGRVRAFRSRRGTRERAVRVIPHLRLNLPAGEIARLAQELEADLVVVGTHGRRALSRLLRGSVAEVAVRLSPCPVLVVRSDAPAPPALRTQPCPDCEKVRSVTLRRELFCVRHRASGDVLQATSSAGRPTRRASARKSPSPRLG